MGRRRPGWPRYDPRPLSRRGDRRPARPLTSRNRTPRFVDQGDVAAAPGTGTGKAITQLREAGVKVVLTTGFSRSTQVRLLDVLGWHDLADLADLALTPAGAGRGCPYPDMILTALLRTGTDDVRLDFSGSADAIASLVSRLDVGGRLVLAGSSAPSSPSMRCEKSCMRRRAFGRRWSRKGFADVRFGHGHRSLRSLRPRGARFYRRRGWARRPSAGPWVPSLRKHGKEPAHCDHRGIHL